MVCQKPVKKFTKKELKKIIKSNKIPTDVKDFAGPKEDLALIAMHRMFIKKLSKTSNVLAFQNSTNKVGQKVLLTAAKKVLDECDTSGVGE